MHAELVQILATEGAIRRADHPGLARLCDWAIEHGTLASILQGVYVSPDAMGDATVRAVAVCLADPDAVIVGRAARAFHAGKPHQGSIDVVSWRLRPRRWLRVQRRSLQPELVIRGRVNLSCPALTALDLAIDTGGESIDDALRSGIKLAELHAVHESLGSRRGRTEIARLLDESRDEPWSPAERRAHVLLREAAITGWKPNLPVKDQHDRVFAYGDLGFRAAHLIVEIDGDDWHLSPSQVLRDRARDQRLTELGWTVVRYSARQVLDEPEAFIAWVQASLVSRAALARAA